MSKEEGTSFLRARATVKSEVCFHFPATFLDVLWGSWKRRMRVSSQGVHDDITLALALQDSLTVQCECFLPGSHSSLRCLQTPSRVWPPDAPSMGLPCAYDTMLKRQQEESPHTPCIVGSCLLTVIDGEDSRLEK